MTTAWVYKIYNMTTAWVYKIYNMTTACVGVQNLQHDNWVGVQFKIYNMMLSGFLAKC